MRRAVGITLERDGRNADDRTFSEPLFQIVIFPLAIRQCDSPPIIMNHDADVIRVVERCSTALERCTIKPPLRRRELPDESRKIVPVLVVAGPAALGGKIVLVPPFEFGLWRQRHLAGFLA